jgi:hypothetical protein
LTDPPVLSALGERLRERTAPLAPSDDQNGWAHAYLCEALMVMLEQVAEVYDPADPLPPGAPLLDPELAPDWALPWVAQLVGARLPAGATPEQARALIAGVSGWKRGTPAALRAAAQLYLTGNRTVTFRERDANSPDPPYTLEVVTLTGETPNPAAVLAALLAQKPGGLVLNYRTVEGQDWQAVQAKTWRQARTTYANWRNLRDSA